MNSPIVNDYNYGYINLADVSFRLRYLREKNGYSLEKVSQDLFNWYNIKLSTSGIWKYENNRIKKLNQNTISALARYYNVTQRFILYGDSVIDVNTYGQIQDRKLEIIQMLFSINDLDALNRVSQFVSQQIQISGSDENNN